MVLSAEDIRERLAIAAFSGRLISNIYRGLVAEVIVESALSSEWKRCSGDWAGWDFIHDDGCKLEVKQSAALQTWSTTKHTKCVFGIAPSKGYFTGDKWTDAPGRQSLIYVFAHHDGTDPQSTDHLDPHQWHFYVIPAGSLPKTRTIGLTSLMKLSRQVWDKTAPEDSFPCDISRLSTSVELIRKCL